MNLKNVRKVLRKELRETLRDRRTMIVMVLVPVFLYPVLLILVQQMAVFGQRALEEAPVEVAVVGGDAELAAFLAADSAIALATLEGSGVDAVRDAALDAVVEVRPAEEAVLGTAPVRIVYDGSSDRSRRAEEVLRTRLRAWSDSLLALRLAERDLPRTFAAPMVVQDSSVATGERMGRYTLGRFLPVLLMMMTLLGTFFPAIDLTAGEKERGTLETLLTSPVANRDIIAGKFATVVLIAIATAALNLASMLLTFQSGIFQISQATELEFRLPAATVALVLVVLVPLAVFFAALFMGLAVRAQTFKEAQNALTPVQIASMLPMYLPSIPGIPFSYGIALIPIGGLAMLFREMMSGTAAPGPALVAVGATVVYAALALRFAARAFGREEVLFGSGTGGASPRTWSERVAEWRAAAHLTPRATPALMLVAVVGLLYFYVGVRLRFGGGIERGLFASQWLLLALPAILFVVGGRYRARSTLALRPLSPRAMLAAVLIIAGGIPISWTLGWLQSFFVEIPEEFLSAFQDLLRADSPADLAWLLLVIAVTPAVCEELVFRGVLLQGLGSETTKWRAVFGSALVFGAFHLSFETFIRFLPTFWLGLLLGYVVWESRSLFAGMLMHFINNAAILLLVASTRFQTYVTGPEGEPRWVAIAGGVALLALGLKLLPRRGAHHPDRPPLGAPAPSSPASIPHR